MLICIEGIDAAGKATQSKLLAERLKGKLISFPAYDTLYGKLLQAHLRGTWMSTVNGASLKAPMLVKDGDEINATFWNTRRLDAMVFQAIQLANKMEMASQIERWCALGHVVLDRYWPSACVYGAMDGAGTLESLTKLHACLPQPDIFVLLDVSLTAALERLKKRAREKDRYELQPRDVVQRRIDTYRDLWLRMHATSPNWVIVDGTESVEKTAERVDVAMFRGIEGQI